MQKARHESKKLVYIGFGSIVVPDPEGLTRTVNEAIIQANVCAIVSKGWAGRLATDLRTDEERAAFNEQQRKEKEMLCDAVFTVDAMSV